MSKKKKEDTDFLSEILAATGGELLSEAGQVPYYVDTGNLALNFMFSNRFINGGYPGGRIIEAYGPEASGKSLLGYCFMGAIQRMDGIPVWLDCERSGNADFAERCGHANPSRCATYYPITLQQVEKKITTVVNAIRQRYPDKPIGIVWDSIGVNPTDREWEETNLPENPTAQQVKDAGGHERPGERAKAANAALRKLNPFLNEKNATLYVVNQVRSKIGVMYGNPETTSGGGEALKFYASLRFRTSSPKEFKNKKTKLPLGVNLSVKNKKNRHNVPGLQIGDIPLFFNGGINPLGGLLEALILADRVEGKTTYTVNPKYSNGETVTFKAAVCNPLDPEVLYKCPGLVDAESAEQVKAYLNEWNKAIELYSSGVAELVDANKEDDVDKEDDVSHLVGNEDE